jgi:hypothetical protein
VILESDFSVVDQAGFDEYAKSLNSTFDTDYETPGSAIGVGLHFRYYAPYYIVAQIGVDALLVKDSYTAKANVGEATIEYWNVLVEVPILVGGHYPVHDRIHVYGLLGPAIAVYSGSLWDSDAGAPDFNGETAVGFQTRFGADFYATSEISFGLELMYRAMSVDVKEKDGNKVLLNNGETVDGFERDFSGFGVSLGVRFVI